MSNIDFNNIIVSLNEMKNNPEKFSSIDIQECLKYLKFAARPHPSKGISGAVCPFLPFAIKQDTIFLSIITEEIDDENKMRIIVDKSIKKFKSINLENEELEKFKSLLLVFMNYQKSDSLLGKIHKEFKRKVIHEGIMIGDFYSTNTKRGLYSSEFNPLKCKTPMIAIRNLIKEDFPFLISENDSTDDKLEFLNGYSNSLKDNLSESQQIKVQNTISELKQKNLVNSVYKEIVNNISIESK